MSRRIFYFLKTHSKDEGINYLQIRSEEMILLGNIRCLPPYDRLSRIIKIETLEADLRKIIDSLKIGEITKIEF